MRTDTMRQYCQQLRQETGIRMLDKVFDQGDKPSKVRYQETITFILGRSSDILNVHLHVLGPRYTRPGLQAVTNQVHHKYKKNIAMTDCLVLLNPAWRQPVIVIFFLYFWCACSLGLVYLGPYTCKFLIISHIKLFFSVSGS